MSDLLDLMCASEPPRPKSNKPSLADLRKGNVPDFHGSTYDRAKDHERLKGLLLLVYQIMRDHQWRTLSELRAATGRGSEASISARLRDLRKEEFGGYKVSRRRRGDGELGVWEYRMEPSQTGVR